MEEKEKNGEKNKDEINNKEDSSFTKMIYIILLYVFYLFGGLYNERLTKTEYEYIDENSKKNLLRFKYPTISLCFPSILSFCISSFMLRKMKNKYFSSKIESPISFMDKSIIGIFHIISSFTAQTALIYLDFIVKTIGKSCKSASIMFIYFLNTIPCCNKFYTLEYVGKIAPTTITSTAVVGGFMCLQLIGIIINQLYIWPLKGHLLNEKDKMDDIDDEELIENGLHNLCFNLKNNEFAFEPLQEVEYDGNWNINNLIPEKYSRWLKIIEGGNKTINEFIQYIKEKYEVNVTLILSAEDDRDIFELISPKRKNKKAREKKLLMDKIYNLKVEDVYFDTARNICKNYNKENEIFLKIKGITDTGFYTEFPVINYKI